MLPETGVTTVRAFVATARTATLATVRSDGRPRLVPICFVLAERRSARGEGSNELVLYSPIDEKPKRSADPMRLARVRDVVERPLATVLLDRWDEDWRRLAWVRLECRVEIVAPGAREDERARAVAALREKYPQYSGQRLEERPLIRLACRVGAAWGEVAVQDQEAS